MSFLGLIILGFLVSTLVLLGGVAIYKINKKKVKCTTLLIINVVLAVLALIYGLTAGFGTLSDPYIVQSVGVMSFGMIPFSFVPLIFLVRNRESTI